MGTSHEVLESRTEFDRKLDDLISLKLPLDNPMKDGGETNFYLAFHGFNDRDLQVKVAKFYEQACPSLLYTAPHCAKAIAGGPRKKIRVAFLSKFLYEHSVSLCFSKIIEALSSREQFEVVLISTHPIDESIYTEFVGNRIRLPNHLSRAREMLAAQELDILVYLDIGMEPFSYFLAFSRLAHVQCVLGGHPVTTGIGNIDYFLSADLSEPPDADAHYSEKLVRLPLGVFYFKRPALPVTFKTRSELGLPEGPRLYLCPMKLQKLHPDFDEAISRILQIDTNGVVVLFEDGQFPTWKDLLMARFEKTIQADIRQRILFLPWIKSYADFISMNAAADVVLDPFHFGIGSTAIATFAVGTPIVTRPGEFLRGRVGMGYCKMLDILVCIATDTESYAQTAVHIANNRPLRDSISAKILKNNHVLYENMQPVNHLADFFCSLTGLTSGTASPMQNSSV